MLYLQFLPQLEDLLVHFNGASVDEVVTVSDAKSLVDIFYEPANTDASAEDFYSAESFLKYGSSLRVIRLNNSGLANANATVAGLN